MLVQQKYRWILAGFLLLTCVAATSLASTQKEAAEAFQKGHGQLLAGDLDQAEATFKALINQYPRSSWVDDGQFFLCEIAARRQPSSEAAFKCFESFATKYRRSNFTDDAQSRMITIGAELARQGKNEYADKVRELQEGQEEALILMALSALQDIGDQESFDAIVDLYDRTETENIRVYIVRQLSEFEQPQAKAQLIRIAKEDASEKVRAQAMYSLGNDHGDAETIRFLQDVVRSDPSMELRGRALRALGETDNGELIPFLVEIANSKANEQVAGSALLAIHGIGGPRSIEAYKQIYAGAAFQAVKQRALREVGDHGGTAGIPFLLEVANKSTDPDMRRAAVAGIGGDESQEAQKALIDIATKNPDPTMRRTALRALGNRDQAALIQVLGDSLKNDRDPNVRSEAARALADYETDAAVEVLKAAALGDSHVEVRRAAVRALGEIGTPAAKKALLEFLGRPQG